jgi:hypothetical protein
MRRTLVEVQKMAADIGRGVTVTKGSHMDTSWGWRHTVYTVVDYNGYGGGEFENLNYVVDELNNIKEYIRKFGVPTQAELVRWRIPQKRNRK